MSRPPLVGPDGRLILETAPNPTDRACLVCVSFQTYQATLTAKRTTEEEAYEEIALMCGLLTGVQLAGSLLASAGLPADKVALVQQHSTSLCEHHQFVHQALADVHVEPVSRALRNLQSASTFLVGKRGRQ